MSDAPSSDRGGKRSSSFGEILSHTEIQALLIRNNAQPQLGVPEYKGWSDNKPRPISQADLDEYNRRANLGPVLSYTRWVKKLDSKRWRFNQGKSHRYAMRAVRLRQGDSWGWTEVELNKLVR